MTKIILLRAINAGVPLKMEALRAVGAGCGYADPCTYIASGNLIVDTDEGEVAIRERLGAALEAHLLDEGASAPRLHAQREHPWLFVRTADELDAVLADNPFAGAPGNKVIALFLDDAPTQADIDAAKGLADEQIALGTRHLYVHFPTGQGSSKLRMPAFERGTGRNIHTVAKLAEMAREK